LGSLYGGPHARFTTEWLARVNRAGWSNAVYSFALKLFWQESNHMIGIRKFRILLAFFSGCLTAISAAAQDAGQDAAELAKAVQNPVASLISVPFQWNINLETGPQEETQHVLNIQPVIPFELNEDMNLITRTIVPLISQPAFGQGQSREGGIGDIQFTAFFSPKKPGAGGWIWGAGPILQMNTASDDRLGQGVWGIGPTAIALKMTGPWVLGGLINNIWSVTEDSGREDVNQMLIQPFINYNFADKPGRYLVTAPIITADWKADNDKWVIPLGMGIGQVMRIGNQPVNIQASAYYNVERPDNAAKYQIRLQIQLMFPK
jgi:hypothetical protein